MIYIIYVKKNFKILNLKDRKAKKIMPLKIKKTILIHCHHGFVETPWYKNIFPSVEILCLNLLICKWKILSFFISLIFLPFDIL